MQKQFGDVDAIMKRFRDTKTKTKTKMIRPSLYIIRYTCIVLFFKTSPRGSKAKKDVLSTYLDFVHITHI